LTGCSRCRPTLAARPSPLRVSVELALTAPALVEDGDPARLIGLMLTQGSAAVGFMVAVVGLVIMTGAVALFLRHAQRS